MSSPKGYLARDMIFNNPAYQPWPNHPVGQIRFPRFTKITLVKPTRHEAKRLRQLANSHEMDAFMIKIEGRRVFAIREALLTEEEYHEIRSQEAEEHARQASNRRSKLALLKERSRGVGKDNA